MLLFYHLNQLSKQYYFQLNHNLQLQKSHLLKKFEINFLMQKIWTTSLNKFLNFFLIISENIFKYNVSSKAFYPKDKKQHKININLPLKNIQNKNETSNPEIALEIQSKIEINEFWESRWSFIDYVARKKFF